MVCKQFLPIDVFYNEKTLLYSKYNILLIEYKKIKFLHMSILTFSLLCNNGSLQKLLIF